MAGALLAAVCATTAVPAHAIEVTCIEASRYKYLFRIFDNDPARFAAFFGADGQRLPNPEACRAVLITGGIERAQPRDTNTDFDKLREAIQGNGGWLSTLYLASPGGNVSMGLRLGEITRMFWLNTHAFDKGTFDYVPDFLGAAGPGSPPAEIPPDLQRGWRDYVAATQAFSRVTINDGRERGCVSACTFIHAGSVHRFGPAHFHRARPGAPRQAEGSARGSGEERSMSDLLENLQKTEARIVAFFRQMDAGDEAVQAYQSTATYTTLSAGLTPVPRYVDDHLKRLCGSQARRAAASSEGPAPPGSPRPSPQSSPAGRAAMLQCMASSNSRERLLQFAKRCPNGCDRHELLVETTKRLRALVPGDAERRGEPSEEPRGPRGRGPESNKVLMPGMR